MQVKSEIAGTTILKITAENIAPGNGVFFSKFWFGLHDGTFDIFDPGERASQAIEQMSEDANPAALAKDFKESRAGILGATILGAAPPFGDTAPGHKISLTFAFDSRLAQNIYLSYAAMIIPSNDAFIANENPKAYPVFDQFGQFVSREIIVYGTEVWDAGTEVNDELAGNAAGVGDPSLFTPGAGVPENSVIKKHPGFIKGGNILSNPFWQNADFTIPYYRIARIKIEPLVNTLQGCQLF
jgi:hypothetical protein